MFKLNSEIREMYARLNFHEYMIVIYRNDVRDNIDRKTIAQAMWAAVDSTGQLWLFVNEPTIEEGNEYYSAVGTAYEIGTFSFYGDWRESKLKLNVLNYDVSTALLHYTKLPN